MFQNLAWVPQPNGRGFWGHLLAPYGSHGAMTTRLHHPKSKQITDFGYPLIMANEVVRCKESHSLLLKCFKALLGYYSQAGEASGGIYWPLMGHMGT